jgi:hypothetical protein
MDEIAVVHFRVAGIRDDCLLRLSLRVLARPE